MHTQKSYAYVGRPCLTGAVPAGPDVWRDATIVSLDCYPPMADNGGYVELIETSTFTRQMTALLSDEDYGEFQSRLATNPGLGALIKGGGGIRKIRVAIGSRGKRGGARVI